jgi:hypothetical protein
MPLLHTIQELQNQPCIYASLSFPDGYDLSAAPSRSGHWIDALSFDVGNPAGYPEGAGAQVLKASSSPLIQARKQEELLPQMAGFPMPPTPKVVSTQNT